jgi:hypothetical protein
VGCIVEKAIRLVAVSCLAAAACESDAARSGRGGAGLGVNGGIDTLDTGDVLETESSGSSESGGLLLDVSGGGPGGSAADDGGDDASCKSVDFLFVIDSSISMATNQADLVAAFPAFVDTIMSTLEEVDSYHVGVVTSSGYPYNDPACTQLGALVTQTGGTDASNAACGPFTEGRYMTDADDLAAGFACAAQVGTGGDNDERMMDAALAAISPELNAPGGCNEGFIRDDALLVLVLITDEDDPGSCAVPLVGCTGSPGDPPTWFEAVMQRKVHPENTVVLSLTRGAPNNVCGAASLAEIDAQRIMTFAELFQVNGFRGDICAPFGPFFDQAVAVIESACDAYIPEG